MLQRILFLACLAPNVVSSLYISSSIYSLNQNLPYNSNYTLVRAPFGMSVQVYSGPVQPPANPILPANPPPPPPRRPVYQPSVFFTQANAVPMSIYSSYICGQFNHPLVSVLSNPQLTYDPYAIYQRLIPLSNWFNSKVQRQKSATSWGLNLGSSDESDSSEDESWGLPRAGKRAVVAGTPKVAVTTTKKTTTTIKPKTTTSKYQAATKNMTAVLKTLRSKLLSGLGPNGVKELRAILTSTLTSSDLELASAAVFDAKNNLALGAFRLAQPFFVKDPSSTSRALAEKDRVRLHAEVIIAANNKADCNTCQVNFDSAEDIALVVFRNSLPPGMTVRQINDALNGMLFLSRANLSTEDTGNIIDNVIYDFVISNSTQETPTAPQSPYVRMGRKRHLSNTPRVDRDSICYVLNNYAQSSRYCGVRTTANLVLSKLNCERDEESTATNTKPNLALVQPTTTTTKPATTSTPTTTTTKPNLAITQPTTTPTTITTTTPTTATTKTTTTPSTTTTKTTTTPTTTTTKTTTTPTTTTTLTTTTTTPTTTTKPNLAFTQPTTTTTTSTTPTTTSTTTTTITPPKAGCGVSDMATRSIAASSSDLLMSLRIVGGVVAGSCTMYPWMVRLNINGNSVCGGTILDATHILTAAHCTGAAYSIQATVGEYDVTAVEGTEQVFDIAMPEGISQHPNFSYTEQNNDIAVITLSTPIDFSRICAKPVCLDPAYRVTSGQKCQIAGWGVLNENSAVPSTTLQTVSISTYNGVDCSATFADIYNGYVTDPARQLCAGEPAGGVDTCGGDSGGPLFCLDEATGKWNVVGVVSYGEGCARPGNPGVYTDTAAYYDWIQQQLTKTL